MFFEDALGFIEAGDEHAGVGAVGGIDAERVALGHGDEIFFFLTEAGVRVCGIGGSGVADGFVEEVAVGGVGLNEAQAAVHLQNGEVVAFFGDSFEDFFGNIARGPGGAGIETIEEKGDEVFGFGLAGDEVKVSKNDGRAVVSDGEVGGFEVEDGLVSFGADNEVEGDFIDGGVEVGGCGRLRGSLGLRGCGRRLRGRLSRGGESSRQEEQGGWQSYTQGAILGPKLKHFRSLPGPDGSGTVCLRSR